MAHHENPFPWLSGSQNPFQHRWDAETTFSFIGKVRQGKTTSLVTPLLHLPEEAPGGVKNEDRDS